MQNVRREKTNNNNNRKKTNVGLSELSKVFFFFFSLKNIRTIVIQMARIKQRKVKLHREPVSILSLSFCKLYVAQAQLTNFSRDIDRLRKTKRENRKFIRKKTCGEKIYLVSMFETITNHHSFIALLRLGTRKKISSLKSICKC